MSWKIHLFLSGIFEIDDVNFQRQEVERVAEAIRISPEEVREKVTSGSALLVCAYEDEQRCERLRLEGSISLTQFKSRLSSLSKDNEIIFYCG